MRSTVTHSTRGPSSVTAVQVGKSGTLYGPSVACMSLTYHLRMGLKLHGMGR